MKPTVNARKILLASSSPRRRQLLEEAGFWFEVVQVPFDEVFPADMDLAQVACHLAEQKGAAALPLIVGDAILLTADSVVILGDRIFGKPVDGREAYAMLAALSGKMHRVDTGVCLRDADHFISFTARTDVFFRELNHQEICWYVDHYQPFDKAGAYAVQEWIGLCKVSSISGTYANVMGLPTDLVYEALRHFNGAIAFPK
ncbi:MAG: septum formation protein Maf [Saprospiraceae bacterium]|jgi:septum formation protein|nr:septum formation protein Maf [Saprospiraceae bacterium]MBP9210026.1 septum formation protein Maf [Saprospiraceae bacterium]MBV6472873.1 Maf-like protein YhdE [Saprospiraceae bacterium]